MKKLLSLALAVVMMLSLAACGGKDEKTISIGVTPVPHEEIVRIVKQSASRLEL